MNYLHVLILVGDHSDDITFVVTHMAMNQILFLNPEFSGSLRNQQEIEFEQSCRRSHAAIVSHRVRKHKLSSIQKKLQRRRHPVKEQDRAQDQKLPITNLSQTHTAGVNCIALYHGDTASESRGLAFFRQRTAVEWSGWKDTEFWTTFIIQASFTSSALRHALVGLAACHESYEASSYDRKESLQQMGIIQGQRALKCLNQEYLTLSTSAILATYIGISVFAARLHPGAYAKIWTLLHEFYDQLKTSQIGSLDEAYMRCYLEPIIERQSSRSAHFLDLSWNLARTPAEYFKSTTEVSVPNSFADLRHARDILEALLHSAAYEFKTKSGSTDRPSPATALMRKWYEALQIYRDTKASSEGTKQSLDILRAYARMNIVMIQTMDTETEMVFDDHLDAYNELAKTFEQFVQFEKKSRRKAANFGADGCFTTLIGHAATRWCREPSIRRKLIRLLYECNRVEGFETAETWGMVADNMRKIEEAGVHPPPTSCYDIPAANRVRMVRSLFYFEPSLLQIRYVRPDLPKGEAEEACFLQDPQGPSHLSSIYPFPEEQLTLLPDLDVGKDYFSWLDKRTNTYRTTKGSNFYFPLPRC